MNEQQLSRIQLYVTALISLAIWGLLLWQYTHQGIPSHHLLNRADLPTISNAWGALLLPALAWLLVGRRHKRHLLERNTENKGYPGSLIAGFVSALIYGGALAFCFYYDYQEIFSYLLQGMLLLAVFFKLYREECLLGFILGMSLTFGAILPSIFGVIIALVFALIYISVHFLWSRFLSLITAKKTVETRQ
jgi:hypothetical protein